MPLHCTVALVLQGPRKDMRWLSSQRSGLGTVLRSMADPLACNQTNTAILSSLSPRTVTDSQYAYAKEEYRAHTIQTSGSDPPASAISSSSMLVCTFRVLDAQRTYYSPSFYAPYGGHASSARETCACAGSRPDDAAVGPQLKRVEGS